jgi:putative ABC transport system ATP-binding protein
MNSHMVIEARDVTLRLGSGDAAVDVLRGLTLDVPAGQRIAILGPSGSGKSSAMAVLSGMERATSGSVRVAGAEFTTMDEDGLACARRGRIGIVLQAFHLIPTMTALENVAVPLEVGGEADVQARAKAELEAVGLGHRLHHYPTQLSGGEQQRVAIARALVGRPALIFADEPTGNLDAATGAAIIDLLFGRLTETGATLVLITHDADLAPLCDRIITMRDGLIVDDRMNLAEAAE